MYKKNAILFFIICSTAITIAAHYETQTDRQENNPSGYGRLLSDAYKIIEKYELKKGTFSNIDYFKERSNSVITGNEPLPLATDDLVNRVNNYRELKLERFELVRFMIGYAKKIAPKDVAIMHAAFDCRVKNISFNKSMDSKCHELYIKHRNKAQVEIENHLKNTNNNNTNKQQKIPEKAFKKIATMMPVIEDNEKTHALVAPIKSASKQVPVKILVKNENKNVVAPQNKKQSKEQIHTNTQNKTVQNKTVQNKTVTMQPVIEKKEVHFNPAKVASKQKADKDLLKNNITEKQNKKIQVKQDTDAKNKVSELTKMLPLPQVKKTNHAPVMGKLKTPPANDLVKNDAPKQSNNKHQIQQFASLKSLDNKNIKTTNTQQKSLNDIQDDFSDEVNPFNEKFIHDKTHKQIVKNTVQHASMEETGSVVRRLPENEVAQNSKVGDDTFLGLLSQMVSIMNVALNCRVKNNSYDNTMDKDCQELKNNAKNIVNNNNNNNNNNTEQLELTDIQDNFSQEVNPFTGEVHQGRIRKPVANDIQQVASLEATGSIVNPLPERQISDTNPIDNISATELSRIPQTIISDDAKNVTDTLTLRHIVEKALSKNPDRLVAVAQYYNSQSQIDVARAGYYPNVNLVLGTGRETNNPFQNRTEQTPEYGYNYSNNANFRFEQMLFDGFITAETVSQRIQQAKATRFNERKVSEEIILSAVQIYMQLRQFQKTVVAAQENLNALHDIKELVDMRLKLGDSNRTEKKYLEGRIASAEQNLINAQVGLGNAQSSLEFITGEKLNFQATLPDIKQDKKFATIESFLGQAFKNNTQISALNAEKQAAEHQLEATLGRYYPKLNFVVEAGHIEDRGGLTGNVRNGIVKLEMTIPIYDGGIRSALKRQRKAEIEEVDAKQLAFQRLLKQDLKTSYQNRVGAIEQIATAVREIESQLALEKLNKQQFRYGEKDIFITDLVESRERVFNAKLNKIRAESEYITSYYRIQQSLGEIFPEFCTKTCQVI